MDMENVSMGVDPEEYDDINAMADMVPEDPEASVADYGTPQNDVGGCVTMNIPLFIRVLEMMREEMPDGENGDELLHRIVEVAVDLCSQHGMITMDQYDELEAVKEAGTFDAHEPGVPDGTGPYGRGAGPGGGRADGSGMDQMGDEVVGVEAEVVDDEECDYANDDAPDSDQPDADEAAEDAEGAEEVEEKMDDTEETEGEGDDDDEEGSKPPFESIRTVRDPIMEEIAKMSYLGHTCVTVKNEKWKDARKVLSDGWDRGYKTLVIDNAVILAEELALPNYKDNEISISRPFSKEEMLEEAYGRWFSLSDISKVTYEEFEKIAEGENEAETTE